MHHCRGRIFLCRSLLVSISLLFRVILGTGLFVRKVHFCVGLNVEACFIVTFTRKIHFHELRNIA